MLTDQRSLLIARHASYRDRPAQNRCRCHAEQRIVIAHLRQHGPGHAEQAAQVFGPVHARDVEQQRAGGIGGIGGMNLPFRQLPQQEAVDRPEGYRTLFRPLPETRHRIEQPGELACRKVGIEHEAADFRNTFFSALLRKPVAQFRPAAVLPDDCRMHGLASKPVPYHEGFPLVGNADRRNFMAASFCLGQCLARRRHDIAPDRLRIMFHPARPGIGLWQFNLRAGRNPALHVDHEGPGRCGALIDRQDRFHRAPPVPVRR